jgi:uncharacterized integral membrane protein
MRYLVRALWLLIFLVLFAFAVANTGTSELHFFGDFVWRTPLVVLLLVFFIAGFAFGVLALLPGLIRMQMELRRLRRLTAVPDVVNAPAGAAVPPDSIQSVAQGARTTS